MKVCDRRIKMLRLCGLIAFCVGGLSGCQTPGGSSGFASVELSGHSFEEIAQTTAAVFREDGYVLRSAGGGQFVFEKNGTALNGVAYGSWGSGVVLRVRTEVVPLEPKLFRLQCAASMVRDAGDRVLEDEQRLAKFQRGPFQTLLEETARRLK